MKRRRGTIWLVDDDPSTRRMLGGALRAKGLSPIPFEAIESAIQALCVRTPDVLILGLQRPDACGFELLRQVRTTHIRLPVIVMTAHSNLSDVLLAHRAGAFGHLPKPLDIDAAVTLTSRALNTQQNPTRGAVPTSAAVPEVLGRAPIMQRVFRAISCLSRSSLPVLITGEAGTGKELVARSLHDHSPRAGRPFIALNTAATPPHLLESELVGRIQQAHGGALFLDEIGQLFPDLQVRLLRVLGDGSPQQPAGQLDVRVIAATRRNLYEQVQEGSLREDLYHRLNVIRIELPPLREHKEDIAELLAYHCRIAAEELGTEPKSFSEPALAKLLSHDWPGNILELVNLCRRVCALSPGQQVREADLPLPTTPARRAAGIETDWTKALAVWADREVENPAGPLVDVARPEFERTLIRSALWRTGGRRQEAAALIGWGRNTLTRKLKELNFTDGDCEAP